MGALSFANPLLLWGALAAAVPIAIHLLSRRRSRRLAFSAVEFILRSRKQKVRHIRLRQILLLVFRTLLVAAIAFAIARPMLRPKEAVAAAPAGLTATALVLDASLSMRYQMGGKTLFQRAKDEAKSLLDGLPSESASTLIICDGRTAEAAPPSFDRVELKRRIESAEVTYRPADVTACINAAANALGQSPLEGKKIFVLSDLTTPSIRLDAPPPKVPTPKGEVLPEVVFIDAAQGNSMPNLSVIDVSLAPSAALGTRGFEVSATIRNSGDKPAENVTVTLKVGGQPATRGYVDVPARGTAKKVLSHRFDPGTQFVEVSVAADALPDDDARTFIVKVPRDVRALVVDGAPAAVKYKDEAFFVDAALGPGQTGGRISATFLDADAAQARPLTDFDVVLLLNVPTPKTSFVESLKTFANSGGGVFISMGDQVNPDEYNAVFGSFLPRPMHVVRTAADPEQPSGQAGPPPARFARVDFMHPAFAIFDGASEGFDSARTFKYMLLRPDAQADERVLASYDDGSPALIEARRGKGHVVLYTSTVDRDWTDWPIRTSFLPAIQQLTSYLAGGLDERPPMPVLVGETRPLKVPEGTTLAEVRGPDGKPVRLNDQGIPVDKPGAYTVSIREGAGTRDIADLAFAAVLDPKESDTTRLSKEELAEHFGGEAHASVSGGADSALPKTGTPLWTWLLVAAMLAFVAEGVLVRQG
jgi:hypothetical protein